LLWRADAAGANADEGAGREGDVICQRAEAGLQIGRIKKDQNEERRERGSTPKRNRVNGGPMRKKIDAREMEATTRPEQGEREERGLVLERDE
jgi:hypothetical protein